MKKSKALAKLVELQEANVVLEDRIRSLESKCKEKEEIIHGLLDQLDHYERLLKENEDLKNQLELVSDEVKVMNARNVLERYRSFYHFKAEEFLDRFYEVKQALENIEKAYKEAKEMFVKLNGNIHDTYVNGILHTERGTDENKKVTVASE